MDIQKQINLVGQYFKNKIIAGDYKVTKWNDDVVTHILIDNTYKFKLWVFEDFKVYSYSDEFRDVMRDSFDFTPEERKKAKIKHQEIYELEYKNMAKKQLESQLEDIKSKLATL